MPEPFTATLPVALQGVAKTYGGTPVLEGVSLSVAAGESLVLVGHNGAGKTTLMKLLLGLVRPSAGQVRVFGEDPTTASSVVRRGSLGYLPESIAFDDAMTGRELLRFYAGLKGVNGSASDELLVRVGVDDAADRRISTWSKGMRQRLGLAQAMLGRPRILLLDEPTSGLDPSLRSTLYEIIETLRADGVTVLISSHALNEVEAHADRVAILRQGRLLTCGTLAELSEQAALPVRLRLACESQATARVAGQFDKRLDVHHIDAEHIELECPHADKMAVLREIADLGETVVDVDLRPPQLDEIYAHFMAPDRPS
jgi:Cu-processing system ATP-binding protein